MNNIELAEKAQSLENACDAFLLNHSASPMRVQVREMAAALEALKVLVAALGDKGSKNPTIGSFPINRQGLRAVSNDEAVMGVTHITYDVEDGSFGSFWTTPPMRLPDGTVVMVPAMEGLRIITVEDIIEMGYSIEECVKFMRKVAEHVAFDFYAKMATAPIGTA